MAEIAKDILAEQGLLVGLFGDPELIDAVAETLRPSDFFEPKNEIIYTEMLKLREQGKAYDPISLASSLKRDGLLPAIGGINYIKDIVDPTNITQYAKDPLGYSEIIKENSRIRQLRNAATTILEATEVGKGLTADDAVSIAEKEIFQIVNDETAKTELYRAEELYEETIEEIHAAKERPEGVMAGIPSGFPDFDKMTNGFHGGQMIIIAARPGVGKNLDLKSTIPTPSGNVLVGDIKLGDRVFGADGNTYNVTGVHEIREDLEMYEVEFSDGTIVNAGGDHEWYTETREARKSRRTGELGSFGRETVMPSEKIEKLQKELTSTKEDEKYSLQELATLMGYASPNLTMIAVAKKLPTVGQFIYKRQATRKSKAFIPHDVANIMQSNTKLARIHEDALILDKVATMVNTQPDELWTVKKIADNLFGEQSDQQAWYYVNKIISRSKIALQYVTETVEYPLGSPSNLYNKRQLLEAYIAHASSFKNDQRHKNVTGSVKTTLEILATLKHGNDERWNHSVPIMKALNLPEAELPIGPYSLGAWLGDGSSHKGEVCGLDHEVFEYIQAEGYTHTEASMKYVDFRKHEEFRNVRFPALSKALRSNNLLQGKGELVRDGKSRKHIPVAYLRASIAQRKELLAGLMDTDGTATPNSAMVQFSNSNKRLIDDVWELVCSLGYAPKLTSKIPTNTVTGLQGSMAYTISWSTTDDVFKLPRKIATHREGVKKVNYNDELHAHRYIVDVRPVGKKPMRCISVDAPEHLYAAGRSFILTHNSTLAVDFARSASFLAGKTVLFFSLEMSKEEMMQRIIAAEARVELQKIRSGDLDEREWMDVRAAKSKISNGNFVIDATPRVNLSRIRSVSMRQMQRPEGLDMIVIDYLGLMETSALRKSDSRQNEISELSRGIKLMAKELNVPIITLSQLNRNSESRVDRVPQVSDLRESGSLEQDADMVLLIHRPEVGDENNRPGEADLIIGKQRSGPQGKVPLVSMLAFSKFVPGQGMIKREESMYAEDGYSAMDDETPW